MWYLFWSNSESSFSSVKYRFSPQYSIIVTVTRWLLDGYSWLFVGICIGTSVHIATKENQFCKTPDTWRKMPLLPNWYEMGEFELFPGCFDTHSEIGLT